MCFRSHILLSPLRTGKALVMVLWRQGDHIGQVLGMTQLKKLFLSICCCSQGLQCYQTWCEVIQCYLKPTASGYLIFLHQSVVSRHTGSLQDKLVNCWLIFTIDWNSLYLIRYRIAEKFDGNNIRWNGNILVKRVWWMNRSATRLPLLCMVWLTADDLPNSSNFPLPNFPAIR